MIKADDMHIDEIAMYPVAFMKRIVDIATRNEEKTGTTSEARINTERMRMRFDRANLKRKSGSGFSTSG